MSTVTGTFRDVVASRPDAPAITEGSRTLTYLELAGRAEAYREVCRAHDVRPGQVVVLQMERGIEATAAMLGILMSGGAYTVIAEHYPPQRRAAMLDTLDVAFVLDAVAPATECEAARAVDPTGDAGRSPEQLTYVVFTSGTTSAPKAVGVPDRVVLRLLDEPRLGLVAGDRITHVSPIEFDASVVELWGGLLSGMTVLCIPARQVVDPFVMLDVIAHRADVMWLTSSLFNFFVDKRPEAFSGLKRVVVGGEALSLHHVNRALPHVEVVNGYGPTENTVFTTLDVMTGPSTPDICIGTAVSGTELAVVDDAGRDCDEGELLAYGEGLAIGYLGDAEKTAAAFVDRDGRRAYRTGDHVRLRPDGRIEYRGRIDSQVKVSGYRIDLQEVESVLLDCGAGTAKAFVDDGRIVAAVTAGGEALRERIGEYLPTYMQPRAIVLVDAIPTTPNGKADVTALVEMVRAPAANDADGRDGRDGRDGGDDGAAALPDVRAVVGSVLTTLGHPASAPGAGTAPTEQVDDLFELGFDSIGLWSLVTALNDAYGTDLTLFDALDDPRVSALERLVTPVAAA